MSEYGSSEPNPNFPFPEPPWPRACETCHGDGVVTVAGMSVNPFSGALGRDPQCDHDETCPDCGGTGEPRD